jgi:cytochrome d ubiquinol oxidase subunit II
MEYFLGIDYPTLWYLVIGLLFSGYAILEGFDFGAGAWHLFFQKDISRRIAINAIAPVWDANQVWLVIGGGALFAGFPVMYATMLSAMYVPFMLFLMFNVLRAAAIKFRSSEEMLWWRKTWDIVYSVSSIMIAFLLGVVLGNILQGFPLGENHSYKGGVFFSFLNPYAIMTGLTTFVLSDLAIIVFFIAIFAAGLITTLVDFIAIIGFIEFFMILFFSFRFNFSFLLQHSRSRFFRFSSSSFILLSFLPNVIPQ